MEKLDSYVMAMCRPDTHPVFDAEGKVDAVRLEANIDEFCQKISVSAGQHAARLICFPQFGLTGYARISGEAWIASALDLEGPEVARLAAAAKAANAYVAIQIPERHAAFPGRYFLSAVLLTPKGKVGLVHRKHYTLSLRTSPIDVHDQFVEAFGGDAFYPVLETEIGAIGLSIGGEVYWPEAMRSLALKGAEVVVNLIAAGGHVDYMERPGADLVRSVRAFENLMYLGMVNIRGEKAASPRVYDYQGGDIGQPSGDPAIVLATIDLAAQRAARAKPGANFLAQLQPAIHPDPREFPLWPANSFAARPAGSTDELIALEQQSWARLQHHWLK